MHCAHVHPAAICALRPGLGPLASASAVDWWGIGRVTMQPPSMMSSIARKYDFLHERAQRRPIREAAIDTTGDGGKKTDIGHLKEFYLQRLAKTEPNVAVRLGAKLGQGGVQPQATWRHRPASLGPAPRITGRRHAPCFANMGSGVFVAHLGATLLDAGTPDWICGTRGGAGECDGQRRKSAQRERSSQSAGAESDRVGFASSPCVG